MHISIITSRDLEKLFGTTCELPDEERESILEPFKFIFFNIEDMWVFCEDIMDNQGYIS